MTNEETIYETYSRTVCNICKNKEQCQEELRIKIDGSIKCDNFETTFKKKSVDKLQIGNK